MKARALSLALCTVLMASCTATPQISFDADPQANFAHFRTYSWAYTAAPQGTNPLLSQRVRTSIDNALAARGFTQADPGDFAVGFTLGARNRVEVSSLGTYGPYFRPWGGWGGGFNQVDVRNITDGTLTIDIYDAASKAPVWHGRATQQVTTDQISQEKVDSVVTAVLANFPPPAGAKR